MTEAFLKALPVVKVNLAACAPVAKQQAELLWVPIDKLLIDTRYQRDMTASGIAHVERIAEKFDWKKFTPLIVAPQGENYTVIDGQHRATAAKARGFSHCPAIAQNFADYREAAAGFAAINGNVTPISAMHVFKAARAAGEAWAALVQEVATDAGVMVLTYPKAKSILGPNETMAVSVLREMVALDREKAVVALMGVTHSRHFGQVALNAYVIKALFMAATALGATRQNFPKLLNGINLTHLVKESAGGAEEAGISRAAWLSEIIIDTFSEKAV